MERCIQDGEDGGQEAQMEGFVQKKHGSGKWKQENARGQKPCEAKRGKKGRLFI